jgi:hydrogenase-4 component B
MRAAVTLLAAACVVLGLVPGLVLRFLVSVAPWNAQVPASPGLRLPGTGALPTIAIGLVLVAATAVLARLRGRRAAAPAPAWACGQPFVPELGWSGAGFTKPLRLVLEGVLRPRREIGVQVRGGVVTEIAYHGEVPNLIDERVYRPVVRRSLAAAAHARRLQTGSLAVYVCYLIALVVAVLIAGRIGLLG